MTIEAGTHDFGPQNGTLWIRTGRVGAAAKAGHDLVILVTAWQATLAVGEEPAQTSIAFTADTTSLRVHEGVGGMQELGDDDKANIEQTIDDEVLMRTEVAFRSTVVKPLADGTGFGVRGDLTLVGNVHPLEFDLVVGEDDALSANVVIKQTNWGLTPYSALFGALKVADEVEVVVNASDRHVGAGEAAAQPAWTAPWDLEWRPGPIVDPRISSALWALLFFLVLWLGMARRRCGAGDRDRPGARGGVLHLPLRPLPGHQPGGERSVPVDRLGVEPTFDSRRQGARAVGVERDLLDRLHLRRVAAALGGPRSVDPLERLG